jgi:CheY-like chemotaxis protein
MITEASAFGVYYNARANRSILAAQQLVREAAQAMSKSEKPMVLLVDDNESTCTLVQAILRHEYNVDIASEGVEALENIKTRCYGVIILDLRMPGLDGFGVLDALQATSPDLIKRVLVVTASLGANDMQRLKAFPICGVIPKPFEVEAFLSAVRNCDSHDNGARGVKPFLTTGVLLLVADLLRHVPR